MGYKVHNTYNHGYKGDFNFIVFVVKFFKSPLFSKLGLY
jgi:hypothetical protein